MFIRWMYQRYVWGPEHPFKGRILRHLEQLIFPERGLPFETHGGIRMYLHPRFEWERHLLRGGTYQPGLCRFIKTNILPGETVAIAGIGFGQQIIIASRATGSNGYVVGIDPHPAALVRARDNIALNNHPDNIKLVSAALGERRAMLPLSGVVIGHVGHGSLIKPANDLPYQVVVESLPQLLQGLGIGKLDVLFLDVIGFELPILSALEPPYLPRLMTVVVHPLVCAQMTLTLQNYQDRLAALGYGYWTLDGRQPNEIGDLRECQLVGVINNTAPPIWLERDPSIPGGVWM